jgi:hypothetical protein
LFFLSTDGDFRATDKRSKVKGYYDAAGLTFVQGFAIPDTTAE